MSAAAFKIPTIFTAVDRFSPKVKKMGKNISRFARKADKGLARAERGFRKLVPGLSDANKQMLRFIGTAAIMSAVVGGIVFSVKSIKEYEDAIASTQAITGKTGDAFIPFEDKIKSVAKETKKSSIEIAKGFEIVGSASPELLKSAEALGDVTAAAITLSKASGDELEVSARSLTGVMNQFSLTGGAAAERTMNVLAAGSLEGSANITQIGESMKNFGSVAAGSNITLEESVALVEVLGKFSLFGAESGTKLRGSILKLQKATFGYASGQFQVNDALLEAKAKFDNLATAKKKDAFLNKTFGAENVSTGRILLGNIDLFNDLTKNITDTNVANEQAAIKSNTLSNRLEELKAGWINMITGSGKTSKALESVKKMIVFVTDNLDTIISVGAKFLLFLGAVKVALLVARGALMAYNIITKAVTAATWLMNVAMAANPIGAIVAVAALAVVALAGLAGAFSSVSKEQELNNEISSRALDQTLNQRAEVLILFKTLRKAKVGTAEYTQTLEKLEQIQPGIIEQYKLTEGALININRAEKDLTASIIKRAEAEVRAEMIKASIKKGLEAQTREVGFLEGLIGDVASLATGKDFTIKDIEARGAFREADILARQQSDIDLEDAEKSMSSKGVQQEGIFKAIQENRESLIIDFKNMPPGVDVQGSGGTSFSTPQLGTTN